MSISSMKFNAMTLVAAVTASAAATAAAGLGWPVWAMFVGWVAFFTGAHSVKGALASYLCLAGGIAIGMIASLAVANLLPLIDYIAFGIVVFFVALVVVSLRALPFVNNIPAYFLGMITVFAAHLPPGLLTFLELAGVGALGSLAALLAFMLQMKVQRRAA